MAGGGGYGHDHRISDGALLAGTGLADARGEGTVIILPVIRIERYGESPSDGLEPTSSSPRRKRRKR